MAFVGGSFEDHDTQGGDVFGAMSADDVLDRMIVLAGGSGAVDLRIGELIVMADALDVRGIDYTSISAFIVEEVDFDRTWACQLANLADSDLEYIKVAVCRGLLPISSAVKAPGRVGADEQIEWVEGVRSGDIQLRKPRGRPRVVLEDPEEVKVVHESRILAGTVLGFRCTDETKDRHVRHMWRTKADGKALIRKAMAPRDPPPERTMEWDPLLDPAAEVLGPRVVPTTVVQARDLLKEMLSLRRTRRLELGLLYDHVVEHKLYQEMGFGTLAEMVKESLPITQRALQLCRDDVQALSFYDELAYGVAAGMDLARLLAVYGIATEANVLRWLAVANRTTVTELKRAASWTTETLGDSVLEKYEKAIEETKDAHTWVALKGARRPEPVPRSIEGVHPDQVEAARWYLANVKIPKQTDFQEVKERERWTCENPLCNLCTLGMHSHHKKFRRHGGGNEKSNAAAVCFNCHLRGVHTAGMFTFISGRGVGPDIWTYPSGRRIMVF